MSRFCKFGKLHVSIEIHFNLKPIPEVEQVTA